MRIIFVALIMIAFSMAAHACSVPSNDIVDNSTSEDGPVEIVQPDDGSDTTGNEQDASDEGSDIIDNPEMVELPAGETSKDIRHSHGYGEAHIRDLVKNETPSEQNIADSIGSSSVDTGSLAAQGSRSNVSSVAIALGGIVLCAGAVHYLIKR